MTEDETITLVTDMYLESDSAEDFAAKYMRVKGISGEVVWSLIGAKLSPSFMASPKVVREVNDEYEKLQLHAGVILTTWLYEQFKQVERAGQISRTTIH